VVQGGVGSTRNPSSPGASAAVNDAKLGEEVSGAIVTGAGSFHFDVIDYHYVPNLIVGQVERIVAGPASARGRTSCPMAR
jgi:hypothetical protein